MPTFVLRLAPAFAQRLADGHRHGERHVQAAAASRHGDQQPRLGALVDDFRNAGRFAAEKQDVGRGERKIRVGQIGTGGQQNQPAAGQNGGLEGREVDMTGKRGHLHTTTLCPGNPLGVKGCGEAGAIGASAAVINAITDAIGNNKLEMPATPDRVWHAIHG